MKLKEFEDRYFFHDSFIESMNYDKDKASLTLIINFAFWMQNDFVKGDEENGLLEVTFHNVKSYECKDGDPTGDFVGILTTDVDQDTFVFNLLDDASSNFMKLRITATSVEAKKL